MKACLFCTRPTNYYEEKGPFNNEFIVDCLDCGKYYVTSMAKNKLNRDSRQRIATLLLERKLKGLGPIAIFNDFPEDLSGVSDDFRITKVDELEKTFPVNVSERISRTLANLVAVSEYPGASINVIEQRKNLFFTQSEEISEVFFIMNQLIDDGYISGHAGFPSTLSVTVKGWNKVSEYEENVKNNSNQAFVAMWFSADMEKAYESSIKKAIEDAGYLSVRIDKKEHNNKIDDEIIAEIQDSKFVIADFTGGRGGVYFEAGYAMGLGKPVIWMVKEDDLINIHFDTRQYSHIVWKDEEDLYSKLYNRIRATIS